MVRTSRIVCESRSQPPVELVQLRSGQRRSLLARWVSSGIGIEGQDRQAVGCAVGSRAADTQGRRDYSKSLLFK